MRKTIFCHLTFWATKLRRYTNVGFINTNMYAEHSEFWKSCLRKRSAVAQSLPYLQSLLGAYRIFIKNFLFLVFSILYKIFTYRQYKYIAIFNFKLFNSNYFYYKNLEFGESDFTLWTPKTQWNKYMHMQMNLYSYSLDECN